MSKHSDRQHEHHEEERLQDTFLSSMAIGAVILAIWAAVFVVYLNRL